MTVNVENINAMIEAIRAVPEPIHMGNFVDRNAECGTTACLAGWANILRFNAKGKGRRAFDFDDASAAADWMGIDYEQGQKLFFVYDVDMHPHEERKALTIELLELVRDHADERIVRWSEVIGDGEDEDGE